MIFQIVGTVFLGFMVALLYYKFMLYSMNVWPYVSSVGHMLFLFLRYSIIGLFLVMFSTTSYLFYWWVGGFISGSLYSVQKLRKNNEGINI
ncbi:hypothetical protein JKY79_00370 [Candidatus Babeliales bacterium]|nr:hypothetical protein [Candidatus Babeliales bacterium]